jgi:hypothetical protein
MFVSEDTTPKYKPNWTKTYFMIFDGLPVKFDIYSDDQKFPAFVKTKGSSLYDRTVSWASLISISHYTFEYLLPQLYPFVPSLFSN